MTETLDVHPDEKVQRLTLPFFHHTEAGVALKLYDFTIYLLNEDDFSISAKDFDPSRHEHAIPKFEMARIYILLCAITGNSLGFSTSDRDTDPIYPIYEKAYQKLVATETDKTLFLGIAKVGVASGFQSEIEQLNELSH